MVVRPSSGAYVAERAVEVDTNVQLAPAEVAALREQVRRARIALTDIERTLSGLLDRVGVSAGPDS